MAITRIGKRVGPFDIRVGSPRDRSYDRIDYPANYTRANPENTIGRFRAAMAKAEGYARPARFAVKLFLPTNLNELAGIKSNKMVDTDERPQFTNMQPSPANPDAVTMQDLSKQMGDTINIHCDSVSMPGHDLVTQKVQYGSEPEVEMVTGHAYEGKINASFYADKYLRERQFMELWQKMAVNNETNKANYYDDYVGKMHIYQLGSLDGEGDRDVPTYGIEAIEVYPATIGVIEYNYSTVNQIVKITVGFNYKQWYNLTTDHIAGFKQGTSIQTQHNIKGEDKGLIGRLPIELQRAGREVFNSAKNQLPIGRITKGKIFPPF
jgi:hypothetical protein